MPSFKVPVLKYSERGWRATAVVAVRSAKDSSKFAAGCMALIDTGATVSCISTELARRMGLPFAGTDAVDTAGGLLEKARHHDLWIYLPDIARPFPVSRAPEYSGMADIDVFIGMDIIMKSNLTIRMRDETLKMSFSRQVLRDL